MPGRFEHRRRRGAFARDDLEHASIGRFHEVVARIFEVDMEAEMIHVPSGQTGRIRRSYRRVFQSFEHEGTVYQQRVFSGATVSYAGASIQY